MSLNAQRQLTRIGVVQQPKSRSELQIRIAAARAQKVSAAKLALTSGEVVRNSNRIARGRIRRFKSYMPSQPSPSPTRHIWRSLKNRAVPRGFAHMSWSPAPCYVGFLPRLAAYVAVVVAAGLLFLAGASVYALMWPKPVVPFGQMGP